MAGMVETGFKTRTSFDDVEASWKSLVRKKDSKFGELKLGIELWNN